MYNYNKYFHYTIRRIMKYLFLIYKKITIETNILLYKTMYNKIFVSIVQEDV